MNPDPTTSNTQPSSTTSDQFLSLVAAGLDLGTITADAKAGLISQLVEKEKAVRVEVLLDAYNLLKNTKSKLNSIRAIPDRFDVEGRPVGEATFSGAQIKERKNLIKVLQDGERNLKKAIENPFDFTDLKKWVSNKGNSEVEKKTGDDA